MPDFSASARIQRSEWVCGTIKAVGLDWRIKVRVGDEGEGSRKLWKRCLRRGIEECYREDLFIFIILHWASTLTLNIFTAKLDICMIHREHSQKESCRTQPD